MPSERDIKQALETPGGHLSIGEYGATLHYGDCRCSGFNGDEIKAQAIAAGLPVIDTRGMPRDAMTRLAIAAPLIAVNRQPDELPWDGISHARLDLVAEAYRRAGADVSNVATPPDAHMFFPRGEVSARKLVEIWLKAIAMGRRATPAKLAAA